MPIPTTAFDPTKTIIPKKTYLVLTPSGGTAVTLPGKVANYEQSIETTSREVPDADGFLVPDRIAKKKRTQSVKFEVEDVKSIGPAFKGTTIEGGLQEGTAELFIVDPDDATGKVALHSNVFKASWQLDGGYNFQHAEVAKATLKIEAMEKMVLTPDATVA